MADSTREVSAPGSRSQNHFQNLAAALCIAFGLVLIAQVQVAGDGMWFWYAVLMNGGKHLYADMHLPLQPLYPLLIAWTMRFLGTGWIVSKLPAVAFMVVYTLSLRLIVRAVPGSDPQKAIALVLGFSMPLLFEASRFDDYHVLTDTFTALSVLLLIPLARHPRPRNLFAAAAALGAFSGLAMVSRLNDGGILAFTVGVVLLFVTRQRRWLATLLFSGVAALVVLAVVLLTGDTLAHWAGSSILHAASAKGGAGRVLLYPLRVSGNAIVMWFKNWGYGLLQLYTASLCLLVLAVRSGRLSRLSPALRAGLVVLALLLFVPLQRHWGWQELPTALADFAVPAAFVCGAIALFGAARSLTLPTEGPVTQTLAAQAPTAQTAAWNPLSLLVLLPLGQIVSGSMSSGGSFLPLTSPVGMFLVVFPISFPNLFQRDRARVAYATALAAMALCCFAYKWQRPFHWHSYESKPLFTGREIYRHPVYGPMVIERDLLALVQPVCAAVDRQPDHTLLTLPFPYPNYFCAVPPWHGNVQTFFDISTAETVRGMIADLERAPPALVVYQRQIKNLESHEQLYNYGRPLPHRALDEFIGRKLQSGQWIATAQQCRSFSDWITIETSAVAAQDPGRAIHLDWNPYRCDHPDAPSANPHALSANQTMPQPESLAQTRPPQ